MKSQPRARRISAGVALAAALLCVSACLSACGGSGNEGGDDGGRNGGGAGGGAGDGVRPACPTTTATVRDIQYSIVPGVDPSLTSLDVHPTAVACPAPVVVWVHGGGWRVGDKRNQMNHKARLWNDAGYTLVSVNYRLTDSTDPTPVMYPTHNEDVASAVAWIHDNIASYGGDPSRLALIGHSAGAQIVASVASDERYLAAHGLPLSTLACAAPLDTEGFDVARIAGTGAQIYVSAFGADPEVWVEASPLSHVARGKGIPPMLLVERGTVGRRRVLQQFADSLRGAGVLVTVVEAGSLTHRQVNALIGAPGDTVMTGPLTSFLESCFGPT